MSSDASEGLLFFALFINGGLAGAIYALIALAFVLIYKASRMINFAIGEWIMWGALLVGVGTQTVGLTPAAAFVFACIGTVALAFVFSRLVRTPLAVLRPVGEE